MLAACNTVGPTAVSGARSAYNDALAVTQQEQMLQNLVRIRYLDMPQFLQVTSVNTQYELRGSLDASVTGVFDNHFSDSTGRLGAGFSVIERPREPGAHGAQRMAAGGGRLMGGGDQGYRMLVDVNNPDTIAWLDAMGVSPRPEVPVTHGFTLDPYVIAIETRSLLFSLQSGSRQAMQPAVTIPLN